MLAAGLVSATRAHSQRGCCATVSRPTARPRSRTSCRPPTTPPRTSSSPACASSGRTTRSSVRRGRPTPGARDRIWFVDPVDGTYNFLSGLPAWCAAIALAPSADGPPLLGAIHQPTTDELWLGGVDAPASCKRCRTDAAGRPPIGRGVDRDLRAPDDVARRRPARAADAGDAGRRHGPDAGLGLDRARRDRRRAARCLVAGRLAAVGLAARRGRRPRGGRRGRGRPRPADTGGTWPATGARSTSWPPSSRPDRPATTRYSPARARGRGQDGRDLPITPGQPRGHHRTQTIASHAPPRAPRIRGRARQRLAGRDPLAPRERPGRAGVGRARSGDRDGLRSLDARRPDPPYPHRARPPPRAHVAGIARRRRPGRLPRPSGRPAA